MNYNADNTLHQDRPWPIGLVPILLHYVYGVRIDGAVVSKVAPQFLSWRLQPLVLT